VRDPADVSTGARIIEWIASALGGALLALVAFRTQLVVLQRDTVTAKAVADEALSVARAVATKNLADLHEEVRREIAAERAHMESMVNSMENRLFERLEHLGRRQHAQLQMTADIARTVGADKRFSDSLLKMLADTGEDL
jgi:hypothetical protein